MNTKNTPEANTSAFRFPKCQFAGGAVCRTCDHYDARWCWEHRTWTTPDKWACSSYK